MTPRQHGTRSGATSRDAGLQNAHASVKRVASYLRKQNNFASRSRLDICRALLSGTEVGPPGLGLNRLLQELPQIERYYWVSALYMLLMPTKRRQRLAAYFTPPHLCQHVLDRSIEAGIDIVQARVLDPASGGAAFLVPWALRFLAKAKELGREDRWIIDRARERFSGIEIEPGLAELSELLLADVFFAELASCGEDRLNVIQRRNALKGTAQTGEFDLVVGNPPYGRVFRPSRALKALWSHVISESHVNTYVLFIALALQKAKNGGIVALVVPTSFIGGPYFGSLRNYILKSSIVLEINVVEKRSEVFVDVIQDTCVLIIRKCQDNSDRPITTCSMIKTSGRTSELGTIGLPLSGTRAWTLPARGNTGLGEELYNPSLSTLADYGYEVRSGYFVWNRSKDRLSDRLSALPGEVPLVWAHNVKSGQRIVLGARSDRNLISFVTLPSGSSALQRGEAIVLQRTTNRTQERRLVAALLDQETAERFGGFVTENHTLVVAPMAGRTPAVCPSTLMALLNSKPVDECYRRVAGTVNISTRLLRQLPLPRPSTLPIDLETKLDVNLVVEHAYSVSLSLPEQLCSATDAAENPPADPAQASAAA